MDSTMPTQSPGALAGLQVVEMGQLIAGPFADEPGGRAARAPQSSSNGIPGSPLAIARR